MKVLLAMLKHETNTFSPVPTKLADFERYGSLLRGRAAYEAYRGTGYSLAGMIAVAEEVGAEIDISACARALPSAPVDRDAFETLAGEICADAARGYDAILLDLHGAMVTEAHDDGEGELLARIRAACPGTPIAAALDFHGTITDRMVANSTVMVGYKTYPHLDMVDTGRRAGRILFDALAGRVRPVMAHVRCPILTSFLRQTTENPPMRELIAAACAAERDGALAVSVFGGFPLADTPDTGLSILAVADRSSEKAQAICRRIRELAWTRRDAFDAAIEPLAAAIGRARNFEGAPILLLDYADNCNSGGTQDSMSVIAEALRQGLDAIAAGPICDPEAVAHMVTAGVGATVTLPIGGKSRLDALDRPNEPLILSGVVRTVSDGRFTVRGPVFTGLRVDLGRTVVLDTGPMELIVSEGRAEPLDLAMFRFVGIEPTAKRFIIIKSKVQYKPTFGAIAKHVVGCNGVGVGSLDYRLFRFRKLRRPIYPLDPMPETLPAE
ncbi:MAG TPA: M81 family metallopeptidase [Alphaproteobacteria bacterium]|nr:M81 family metallopeptidase [Alphaproteobacteria bacterium]